MRYRINNSQKIKAKNRAYYLRNHDALAAKQRLYSQTRMPSRIDIGVNQPKERVVDLHIWQREQERQSSQQRAAGILSLAMRGLSEDERRFLLAFEANEYDMAATAKALRMNAGAAATTMERIRNVTRKAISASGY